MSRGQRVTRFEPDRWYGSFGNHPAALRVESGEVVDTTTLDSLGGDGVGAKRSSVGNPLTGPIHVEGCEPGDFLVVSILALRVQGPVGFTLRRVAPHLLGEAGKLDLRRARWSVRPDEGRVVLDTDDPAGRLEAPLQPMLGCLGTAPGPEAVDAGLAGYWGGNMDCPLICEGAMVFLPAAVPGGLLFLGDGHAWQADGEVLATGVETAMEVKLAVASERTPGPRLPHGESAGRTFAIGSATNVERAFSVAIRGLLDVIRLRYGLSDERAHLLLGTHLKAAPTNLYNETRSVVCWLPTALFVDPQTHSAAPR